MTCNTSKVAASRSRASASPRVSHATFFSLSAARKPRRRAVLGAHCGASRFYGVVFYRFAAYSITPSHCLPRGLEQGIVAAQTCIGNGPSVRSFSFSVHYQRRYRGGRKGVGASARLQAKQPTVPSEHSLRFWPPSQAPAHAAVLSGKVPSDRCVLTSHCEALTSVQPRARAARLNG